MCCVMDLFKKLNLQDIYGSFDPEMLPDPLSKNRGIQRNRGYITEFSAKRIPWVMTKRGITTIVYSRPSDNPHLLNSRRRFPRGGDVSKKNK